MLSFTTARYAYLRFSQVNFSVLPHWGLIPFPLLWQDTLSYASARCAFLQCRLICLGPILFPSIRQETLYYALARYAFLSSSKIRFLVLCQESFSILSLNTLVSTTLSFTMATYVFLHFRQIGFPPLPLTLKYLIIVVQCLLSFGFLSPFFHIFYLTRAYPYYLLRLFDCNDY